MTEENRELMGSLRGAKPRSADKDANGKPDVSEDDAKDTQVAPLAEEEEVQTPTDRRRKIFNLKLFVGLSSLLCVIVASELSLRYSVLTTLERRFTFSTTQNGIIIAGYDGGHVFLLIFLAIYGHKMHKPIACFAGCILQVLGNVVWALPHFMFGPGTTAHLQAEFQMNHTSLETEGMCSLTSPNMTGYTVLGLNGTADSGSAIQVTEWEKSVTFWIFLLSQALAGAALAPFLTVALTYIDDNTDPKTSAVCVGIFLSIGTFGFLLGFLIGAGCTSVFVDLSSVALTPKDPGWVGAWWLGSLIMAGIMIPLSIPIVFFPRHLKEQPTKQSEIYREEDDHKDHTTAEKLRAAMQKKVADVSEAISESPDKGKSGMRELMTNRLFWFITFGICVVMYVPAGLVTFLPKYYEVHYLLTSFMANIITAVTGALTMAIGTFLGGYITSYFDLTMRGMIQLCIVAWVVGSGFLVVLLFLECPQPSFNFRIDANGILNATELCNANCSCPMDYVPVCGSDNNMYMSACHAGCQLAIDSSTYANCSCIPGADGVMGSATEGWCGNGCTLSLVFYSLIVLLSVVILYLSASPLMSLVLRSIPDPKYKSIGMGISNVATSAFGTVPAPMVFGWLIDTTCVAMSPPRGTVPSYCLHYDINKFRLVFHGACIVVMVTGIFLLLVPWIPMVIKERKEAKRLKSQDTPKPEEVPMVENPRA